MRENKNLQFNLYHHHDATPIPLSVTVPDTHLQAAQFCIFLQSLHHHHDAVEADAVVADVEVVQRLVLQHYLCQTQAAAIVKAVPRQVKARHLRVGGDALE